jgi:hypothetical protein
MKSSSSYQISDIKQVPLGQWPRDKKMKELGMFQREHMILCVEAFTLALCTRVLGWSMEETQVLVAGVKDDFRNPKKHRNDYIEWLIPWALWDIRS